jgi:hypothetical protein
MFGFPLQNLHLTILLFGCEEGKPACTVSPEQSAQPQD